MTPTAIAKALSIDAATIAAVLADPKCPPASKFIKPANYLKRLAKMAAKLSPAHAPASKPTPARPRMKRKAKAAPIGAAAKAVGSGYEKKKTAMALKSAADSKAGRDIAGKLDGGAEDTKRRKKAGKSLLYFLETYFPHVFFCGWSSDHLKVIKRIEAAILKGGNAALAMPRGNGKTSIVECAAIWAIVYGYHDFVMVIGATGEASEQSLGTMKAELDSNDLLFADFPLEIGPIRMLEGIASRANGQLFDGERTKVKFNNKDVRFGEVKGSKASGAIIRVAGIDGRVRGQKFGNKRPSLVLLDDPQTDESAKSRLQTSARMNTLRKAIMGLGGGTRAVTVICPCTIIEKGDFAHQILDRENNPEFHGIISRLVNSWPTNKDLWEQYADIRRKDLADEDDQLTKATAFYAANRKAMDEGADMAWEERHEAWELSAIQNAFDIRARVGEDAFEAEYQNSPRSADDDPDNLSMPATIQTNGRARSIVPEKYTKLVVSVDVQKYYALYTVMAVTDDFSGAIVEYGTYPDQGGEFNRRKYKASFYDLFPGMSEEAAMLKALTKLFDSIVDRDWAYEGGGTMKAEKILVDEGHETKIVREAIKRSKAGNMLQPIKGFGRTAKEASIMDFRSKPGDRVGEYWRIPVGTGTRVRSILADVNYWKTFLMRRAKTQEPEAGALSIYGKAEEHSLFFNHFTAEYGVKVSAKGRTVYEWALMPGSPENDLLDCVVYSLIAASVSGCKLNRKPIVRKKAKARTKSKGNFATGGTRSGGGGFAKNF